VGFLVVGLSTLLATKRHFPAVGHADGWIGELNMSVAIIPGDFRRQMAMTRVSATRRPSLALTSIKTLHVAFSCPVSGASGRNDSDFSGTSPGCGVICQIWNR